MMIYGDIARYRQTDIGRGITQNSVRTWALRIFCSLYRVRYEPCTCVPEYQQIIDISGLDESMIQHIRCRQDRKWIDGC